MILEWLRYQWMVVMLPRHVWVSVEHLKAIHISYKGLQITACATSFKVRYRGVAIGANVNEEVLVFARVNEASVGGSVATVRRHFERTHPQGIHLHLLVEDLETFGCVSKRHQHVLHHMMQLIQLPDALRLRQLEQIKEMRERGEGSVSKWKRCRKRHEGQERERWSEMRCDEKRVWVCRQEHASYVLVHYHRSDDCSHTVTILVIVSYFIVLRWFLCFLSFAISIRQLHLVLLHCHCHDAVVMYNVWS